MLINLSTADFKLISINGIPCMHDNNKINHEGYCSYCLIVQCARTLHAIILYYKARTLYLPIPI